MKTATRAHDGRNPLAVQGDRAQQECRKKVGEPLNKGSQKFRPRPWLGRPQLECCPIPTPHAQSSIYPRRLSLLRLCRSLAATLYDAIEKILEQDASPDSSQQLPRPCDSPLYRGVSHRSFRGPGEPGNGGSLCRVFRAGFEETPCASGRDAPVSAEGPYYRRPGLGGVVTVRRLRPFARRRFITSLPPGVAIRARKPWRRRRLRLLGW